MSSDPVVHKGYTCEKCGRNYQRSAHLRRHEASHTRPNQFKCRYCEKEFSRSDVCKKHSISCPHKFKADSTHGENYGKSENATGIQFSASGTRDPAAALSSRSSEPAQERMPFLRQIFNPYTVTMQHYLNVSNNDGSFNESVPDSNDTSTASPASAGPSQDVSDVVAMLPSGHLSILDDAIVAFTASEDFDMFSISKLSPIPALTDTGYEILVVKATSLIADLRKLHYKLEARTPRSAGPHDIAQIEAVFCAEKLRFYTAAFFRLTHVHFPLVHYPSFGTAETSTCLILAVAIFGASRSAPMKHTSMAKTFSRLAEEYIFQQIEEIILVPPQHLSVENLQMLQAAVAMTNLMINHNEWSPRERARLKRLPRLIYAARLFKLTGLSSGLTINWHEFVYNETRVRIAIMTAMVDWNQSRMFYYPPSLVINEMRCRLPCHRELWDAPNQTTYIVEKEAIEAAYLTPDINMGNSISDLVTNLMAEGWAFDSRISSLNLTLESLSAASLAITALTVSACQMLTMRDTYPSIVRAISRWQELWQHITCDMDSEVLLKAGLTRHCHENCTLARCLAETHQKSPDHPYFQEIGHNSLVPIFNIVTNPESIET